MKNAVVVLVWAIAATQSAAVIWRELREPLHRLHLQELLGCRSRRYVHQRRVLLVVAAAIGLVAWCCLLAATGMSIHGQIGI